MMNNKNSLLALLDQLKSLENHQWDVNHDFGEVDRFPSMGQIGIWNYHIIPRVLKFVETCRIYYRFLSEDSSNKIKTKIEEILSIYLELQKLNDEITPENVNQFSTKLEKLDILSDNLEGLILTLDPDYILENNEDIIEIIDIISSTINFDENYYKDEILKINSSNLKQAALQDLILFYNSVLAGVPEYRYIHNINSLILNESKKNIKKTELESNIELEIAKNEYSIIEFKNKADQFKRPIRILNILIYGAFSIMILIVFTKFISQPDLKDIYYSIPLILVLSSFIAYLNKEKKTLSDQYHNYMKCHTELIALSTYIVGIDRVKSENLKIHLADKYFTGYGQNDNNSIATLLSNENINQIISLLKDIQKK
ncbi:hypothetical protein [Acinetobacter indicus]|uniref:hypothetical protein n=2 Tax=Acinetobacter indicus TaxID=756892 RepID=UPI003B012507